MIIFAGRNGNLPKILMEISKWQKDYDPLAEIINYLSLLAIFNKLQQPIKGEKS